VDALEPPGEMRLVCETCSCGRLGRWGSPHKQPAGMGQPQPYEVRVRSGVIGALEVPQQRELVHSRLAGDRVERWTALEVRFEILVRPTQDGFAPSGRGRRLSLRYGVDRLRDESRHQLVRLQLGLRHHKRECVGLEGGHRPAIDEAQGCWERPVRQPLRGYVDRKESNRVRIAGPHAAGRPNRYRSPGKRERLAVSVHLVRGAVLGADAERTRNLSGEEPRGGRGCDDLDVGPRESRADDLAGLEGDRDAHAIGAFPMANRAQANM
jgi:hypothetical protein